MFRVTVATATKRFLSAFVGSVSVESNRPFFAYSGKRTVFCMKRDAAHCAGAESLIQFEHQPKGESIETFCRKERQRPCCQRGIDKK